MATSSQAPCRKNTCNSHPDSSPLLCKYRCTDLTSSPAVRRGGRAQDCLIPRRGCVYWPLNCSGLPKLPEGFRPTGFREINHMNGAHALR